MTFALTARKRTPGKAEALRAAGQLPAVVYGPQMESLSVSLSYRDFEKMYREAGESSLISCAVEGANEPYIVLVQDVQYDPVRGNITHVDLRQINMKEEMHATTEIHFVGESLAVKGLGGTLITPLEHIEITCLPQNLVSHIDVDLSTIKSFDDVIHVKDLALPAGITVDIDEDTVVAKVAPPLTEDEIKAMEESGPASVDEVEVAEKKKTDDAAAEGAEGAEEKK